MTDLITTLTPLVEDRKRFAGIRDAAQIEYDRLGAEIAVAMIAEGHEKLTVGDYVISVREQSRDTINKDMLVELGVGTDIILAATKKSAYTVVDVRAAGKKP